MASPLTDPEARVRKQFIAALNRHRLLQGETEFAEFVVKGVAGALVLTSAGVGVTDHNGKCVAPLGPTDTEVVAIIFKPGYFPEFLPAIPSGPVTLQPAWRLEIGGRLVDRAGKPLNGIDVKLRPEEESQDDDEEENVVATTTLGGRFHYLRLLKPRPYLLSAARDGSGYAEVRVTRAGAYLGDLRLEPTGRLDGKGLPWTRDLPGWSPVATPPADEQSWKGVGFQLKPGGGKAQLQRLPPWAKLPFYRRGEGTSLWDWMKDVALEQGATERKGRFKRFRLVDGAEGWPLSGVIVTGWGAPGVTGTNGEVALLQPYGEESTECLYFQRPGYIPSLLPAEWAREDRPIAVTREGAARVRLTLTGGFTDQVGLSPYVGSGWDPVYTMHVRHALSRPNIVVAVPLTLPAEFGATEGETYTNVHEYIKGTYSVAVPRVSWPIARLQGADDEHNTFVPGRPDAAVQHTSE